MYIEQQNRNVTEEFTWNDASLLTGVMILGAEMCSDRKVDAQVKTQVEIDEEIGHAHDKLYPGDFKICVNPLIVGDLITPKKHLDAEGCNISNRMSVFERIEIVIGNLEPPSWTFIVIIWFYFYVLQISIQIRFLGHKHKYLRSNLE